MLKNARWTYVCMMALLLSTTGCWPGAAFGDKVWVSDTQELIVPIGQIEQLTVATHNGKITVTGQDDRADISVMIKLEGGANTEQAAHQCLEAIEIVSTSDGGKGHKLGWKWRGSKARGWTNRVSFEIKMPANLAVQLATHNGQVAAKHVGGACAITTHNGAISSSDVGGPCSLTSHNGRITAKDIQASLAITSHNGRIGVQTSGTTVAIVSHNGRVEVDASACSELAGSIETYNGQVTLNVGESTASNLTCKTHNGGVSCDVDWEVTHKTRNATHAKLAGGGPALTIETHNGRIHIAKAS